MKNILKIIKIAKPLHKQLLALSLLILLAAITQQAPPIIIRFIVDQIELQITSGTGNLETLYWLIAATLLLNISSVTLTAINQRFGDYISGRLGKYLTEIFYKKIFKLPQKYFDGELSGKIINQLTRGILTIQDFTTSSTNFIFPALLQSITSIAILAFLNPSIAIFALLIFPFYIAISHYSTKQWGKKEVEKNQIEDQSRGRIQEVITNIKLVKSFNTQVSEWKFVSHALGKIVAIYDRQSATYHRLNFSRNFGLEFVLVLIIAIAFKDTFSGDLSLGEMVLILQLLNQLRMPLFAMSFILERIQRAEAGSKEFFEILQLPSSESFNSKQGKTFKNPTLEFRNVSFNYANDSNVLKDVSFRLKNNQTVALVGHSGAGKTTIVNLILKFYEPTGGDIFIDSKKFDSLSHQTIRNNISLVFQDNELFSSTIRQNVAYGIKTPKDAQIISALKKANAYEFVKNFSDGLDAKVGERGVKLSGGQKQRIQIARAIMHNSPILILDEATSSLDAKSEKLVQDALENLYKNRLVIIIAHRFSTIQNVNHILVIENGKISAQGNPQKLAHAPGTYQELLQYQLQGNQKLLEKYELA